ncbi:MAG: hypothetical protein V8R10_12580 [Christensenellales bacterium]
MSKRLLRSLLSLMVCMAMLLSLAPAASGGIGECAVHRDGGRRCHPRL